jgi:hypothetical protein
MALHVSDQAKAVLLSLGWSEDRTMDVNNVVLALHQRGYIAHDISLTILRSFLGIYVEKMGAFSVDFTNPSAVGRVYLRNQLLELNPDLFDDLYPIATTVSSCVFVNRSGMIFCVDNDRYSWHGYRSLGRMLDVMLRIEQPTADEQYVILAG